MRKLILTVLLLAASACMSGTTTYSSAGGGIPQRPAAAAYPNWEYFCSAVSGGIGVAGTVNDLLARAGREGWELVNFADSIFCFKRPVNLAAAPPAATPVPTPPAATPMPTPPAAMPAPTPPAGS